jgi:hypothetical protein
MADEPLKQELTQLMDSSESFAALDPVKRGELKNTILNLPERQMRQVAEQLKDEKQKLATNDDELVEIGEEARNEARTLHALYLKSQRDVERKESESSSETILKQLVQQKKTGCMGLIVVMFLPMAAIISHHFFF